jgi:hypothetical protein
MVVKDCATGFIFRRQAIELGRRFAELKLPLLGLGRTRSGDSSELPAEPALSISEFSSSGSRIDLLLHCYDVRRISSRPVQF